MKTSCVFASALLLTLFSAAPALAQTFTLVTADNSPAVVGRDTSQVIVNGNPAVSYWNVSSNDLKYVRANDASGTAWGTPVTVDSPGNVGQATSMAIVNGNPAICYYDSANQDLKYVRATDVNGTTWGTPVTVAGSGINVGLYSSMRVVNGNPAICYQDSTGNDLKFVRSIDVNGAGWGTPVTIDGAGGLYISMQLLPDNSPGVSYGSGTTGLLKFIRATDATATTWMSPVTADATANSGYYTSLQIINGRPAIAYVEMNGGNLKYVRSSDPNGLGWIGASGAIAATVANANFGGYASLQVVTNKAVIAFWDGSSEDARYVTSTDTLGNGSTWGTAVNVDTVGSVGENISLQVLAGGNPGISYYDGVNGNLKYAYTVLPTAPEIVVEQPAGTNIADGGTKDFGTVSVGSNTSLVFTVKNIGTANLTGLAVTKDGTNSTEFIVTVSPTAPVAAAGSTTFTVLFVPGGGGARTAALHIANNDSDENPFDINLTGTGTAPEIAVEQPANSNLADGGTRDFGSVATGGDNSLTFTIKNTGAANLTGLTITKDGVNSTNFIVTASPTAPVVPNGSTTFTVRFVPGGTGAYAAALHIANNDSDENPFDINVTGTGTSTGLQAWSASAGNGNGAGNGVADNLRVRLNGANVEFSADGGATWTASSPIATLTTLTLNGSSDDDAFVIDFSGGNPIPSGGIFVNGGTQVSIGDRLTVTGGATTTVTHSFLNANDGSITLAGLTAGSITYTGLEPITDNLAAVNRVFTFGGGAETITLVDAPGAAMTIDSTLSESVTFANPSASLAINMGTGTDTLTITSVDGDGPFNAALTINGDAGTDTVNFNGDITLAAGRNLVVSAETVTVGANADLTTSGAGTITINADSLAINATATLSAGTVTLAPNTAATTINLGGADAVGTLGLTDVELNRITAGTINIGDATSGDLTVSAAITRPASTILNLNSGAKINLNASSLNSGGGNVTLNAGTSVNPTANGTDVSMGTNGNLAFGSGNDLAIVINGATVDTQYRQLNIVGKVDVTGVDLVLSGSYTPVGGNAFTIINNDGSDAIVGTFTGLPEGANITFNGATLRLSYVGGDGNDAVLSVLSSPVIAANNAAVGVNEGNSITNTGTFSDADGNATVTLSASSGSVSQNNGAGTWIWTFNSTDGPDQSQTITIRASDGLFTNFTTFSLNVTNVAPAAGSQSLTTPEDVATNIVLTATDAGIDTITNWLITVGPTHGTLIGTAPNLNYSPNTNFHGADSFKFTATDSDGGTSSEATINLTVTSVNDAPIIGALTNYTVNPGSIVSFTATATDVDTSDILSFSLGQAPASASITSGGAFQCRPQVTQAGTTNTISIIVSDSGAPNLSATNSFTVIVNPLAPVLLTPISYTNGGFQFEVSGTAGPDYVMLASTNLMDWAALTTNLSPVPPFRFTDPGIGSNNNKFYRVRLQP